MDEKFLHFRNDTFIATIANTKKWTVSTNQKVPIDMHLLITQGRISGALFNDETSLVSLDELHDTLPTAANYAFYLDALLDNFVVLDIEPKCPDPIKNQLKNMPCLYCETSMSGHGIHMVFHLPNDILTQYPDARQKVVFKEDHGWYEILLNHYVTFTGNILPANIGTNDTEFRQLFTAMASQQKYTTKADIDIEQIASVETRYTAQILETLRNHAKRYKKSKKDFNDDISRYEFAYMAYLYKGIQSIISIPIIAQEHDYNDAEQAWFMFTIASELLPSRAKHEEFRDNMPWLLYLAFEVIAKNKKGKKS